MVVSLSLAVMALFTLCLVSFNLNLWPPIVIGQATDCAPPISTMPVCVKPGVGIAAVGCYCRLCGGDHGRNSTSEEHDLSGETSDVSMAPHVLKPPLEAKFAVTLQGPDHLLLVKTVVDFPWILVVLDPDHSASGPEVPFSPS